MTTKDDDDDDDNDDKVAMAVKETTKVTENLG